MRSHMPTPKGQEKARASHGPAADPAVSRHAADSEPASGFRHFSLVLLLGTVTSIVAALLANAFVGTIGWLNDLLLISPASRAAEDNAALLMAATVIVPTIGGLIVGVAHRFIHERRPHAPPEVIAAVQSRQARLPGRPALITGFTSLISLSSGASVGQYGPLVHIGGSLGSAVSRLFRADVTTDNITIACGVAAAIAAVFNAPLAGILFAHEVILRHFALRAFAPLAIASILGYVVANAILPQPPLLQVEGVEIRYLWEFGPFLVLGVASAVIAMAYMSAILHAGRLAARVPLHPVLKPAVAGIGLGLVALWVPDILGMGTETLRATFVEGAYSHWQLLLILTLKILATAWCLGMGFAGGVFSPAMVVGALFGALFGTGLGLLLNGVTSELVVYAVCGMVAVTAPVIGAPLTTVVIVFELTGSYELTLAALASVALANLVTARVFGRSLYDRQLLEQGLDLSGGRSKALLASRTIADLISDRHVAVTTHATVAEARYAMALAGSANAYLVDPIGHYHGTVRLQHLVDTTDDQPVIEAAIAAELVMRPDTTIWDAMEVMRDFIGEGVAVVDAEGKLLGTVFESDLIRAHLEILAEIRREEHGSH